MKWIKLESCYEVYHLVNETEDIVGAVYSGVEKGYCWRTYDAAVFPRRYTTLEDAKAAVEASTKAAERSE